MKMMKMKMMMMVRIVMKRGRGIIHGDEWRRRWRSVSVGVGGRVEADEKDRCLSTDRNTSLLLGSKSRLYGFHQIN